MSAVDKGIITRFLRDERSVTVETADKLLAALGCEATTKRAKASAPAAPDSPKRAGRGTPGKKQLTKQKKGR